MILTCPQCDTRFVVPSTIFMKGGRKLRCSSCKHSWFQDEPMERAVETTTATPLSTKQNSSFIKKIKNDFRQGYGVIGGAFALVLVAFFAYKMMTPSLIVGQGLAFDSIAIERDGTTLNVTGEIVNAMDADRGVPPIQITRIMVEGIMGDSMIYAPEKDVLHSGESLTLSITLDNVDSNVKDLKMAFKIEDGH